MEEAIVLYPSTGRGHLNSMVEFACHILTLHPSFSVIVIISSPPISNNSTPDDDLNNNIASLITSTNNNNSHPSITFLNLPTISSTPSHSPPAADIPTLAFESARLNNPSLHRALSDLASKLLIRAFIIDFFCSPSFQVSSSLKIPTFYYLTCGASGLAAFLHSPTIHKTTTRSLKDMDITIHVPGLPPLPSYDMPMLLQDRNRKSYEHFIETATRMPKSAGLIINTFEALEGRPLEAVVNGRCTPGEAMPPVYCVGPIIAQRKGSDQNNHECLSWLDSQPSRSVLYLSFGSAGRLTGEQLREIAVGLESSGVRFLWVIRTPRPERDPTMRPDGQDAGSLGLESFLPEGFLETTRDRGLLVRSWVPQVEILSHDSVGGFVTHCGWNSVLEAVCAGVPMLAWPLYAEQKVNRAFLVEDIKLALPISQSREGFVTGAELERRVTELMDSERGKEIRERVTAMRGRAVAAMREGGPSLVALARLVEAFQHN